MDVASALATIASISELTKLIVKGKIDNEVKAKAAELNNSILSLQGTLFSLQSQNQELLQSKQAMEAKLVKMSNWQNEASRYELHELCSGVFVYSVKSDESNTEPAHYICPNCYESQRKSILSRESRDWNGTKYRCKNPNCKALFNNHADKSNSPI